MIFFFKNSLCNCDHRHCQLPKVHVNHHPIRYASIPCQQICPRLPLLHRRHSKRKLTMKMQWHLQDQRFELARSEAMRNVVARVPIQSNPFIRICKLPLVFLWSSVSELLLICFLLCPPTLLVTFCQNYGITANRKIVIRSTAICPSHRSTSFNGSRYIRM